MADQQSTPARGWLANPTTPLEQYLAACHRFYLACRDGKPRVERDSALAEAKALEALANAR